MTNKDGWRAWRPDKYLWGFNDPAYGSTIIVMLSDDKWYYMVDFGSYEVRGAIESDIGYNSAQEAKEAALTAFVELERERYKRLKETLKSVGRKL